MPIPNSRLLAPACFLLLFSALAARADETCQSPYLPRLVGQEDYVYVWTLGIDGVGDGSDKLVAIGANPANPDYKKVASSVSVGGRHEAHHGGPTDDLLHLWVGGLDDSRIFVFDVATDPALPKLVRTISDFPAKTGGVVGPHGFYALPGRMLISALSNAKDDGGRTALVEYNNDGEFVRTLWMPDEAPYGYDARIKPELNRMLTSSFTGWSNYMMDFGQMLKDAEAMKRFGQTVVVWDFHARTPKKVLHVPGAPLEIRFANLPGHDYAFTTAALTSKLWLIHQDARGEWQAKAVADIGDPAKIPLPVSITLSADDRTLWVDSFMDGTVRAFDVADPFAPRQIYEKKIGSQLNMNSQSWDGKRIYFTSSVLARWDKKGADNEQFLKAYTWDGKQLEPRFSVDFTALALGRPHHMRFGSTALYR